MVSRRGCGTDLAPQRVFLCLQSKAIRLKRTGITSCCQIRASVMQSIFGRRNGRRSGMLRCAILWKGERATRYGAAVVVERFSGRFWAPYRLVYFAYLALSRSPPACKNYRIRSPAWSKFETEAYFSIASAVSFCGNWKPIRSQNFVWLNHEFSTDL